MTSFTYKATTRDGRMVEGTMEAQAEAAVVASLRGQGYIPLSVVAGGGGGAGTAAGSGFKMPSFKRRAKVKSRDLMLFTRELATLLQAGLPLDRSLQTLATLTESDALQEIVSTVLTTVQQGKSLSEALAEHPEVFPPLYINMIRAAESGGVVESVLGRLADYLEKSEETRSQIKSALVYPVILGVVSSGVILVLLVFVLPRFSTMFAEMSMTMPASTQFVLNVSEFVQSYWWAMFGAVAALYFAFGRWLATKDGRERWDGIVLTLPRVGDLVQKVQVARLGRTLGTMLKSGVPLLQSLDIVRAIVGNVVISNALETVQQAVSEGKGLAGPLEETGVFPSMAVQMVAVGENTGRLDEMLLIVSDHYDGEVANAVAAMMSLLGPAVLLTMGLLAGFIVISMMQAVFSMNQISF